MIDFSVNPPLPADVLAAIPRLPTKPAPVTLTGRCVRLEPTVLERDLEPLYAVSHGKSATLGDHAIDAYDAEKLVWRYLFAGPFPTVDAFAAYLRPQVEAANGLCLTVFDIPTDRQVGVLNYMNNFPEHLKIELGSIWYSPLVQRTHANTEATYLTLKHAFELGYRRLEWKCDSINERSRRAALRMGFQFEGIQEYHMVIKGRNRDTCWYRILDHEWPSVQRHLEGMLYT